MALLVAEAHARADVERFLDTAFDHAQRLCDGDARVQVFPPVPAAMARRRGFERGQVMAQSDERKALLAFLPRWREALATATSARVRWALDVDPIGF